MKEFRYKDMDIRYRVIGEAGPVYLLLHGFGGGIQDWSEISERLAKNYRVVVPNLKIFFSHAQPITFDEQVNCLDSFVNELLQRKGVPSIRMMGQSYGATLSLGLRYRTQHKIEEQTVINPMPFQPFDHICEPHVKTLLNLGYLPGGIELHLKTERGRKSLEALATIFRIGSLGDHEIKHFNERKLMLIIKAFDRFRWIDKHSNWQYWIHEIKNSNKEGVTRYIFSSEDPLYHSAFYKEWAKNIGAKSIIQVEHKGHLLIQDCPMQVPI